MMVLTLNSEPFDVTIENEKTLEELISGLSEWLSKSGYEITGLVQDGMALKIYNNEWQKTPLINIKELDIIAIPESSRYISDLQTVYQYITLLKNSLEKDNNRLTEDLLSELPFIVTAMDSFLAERDISAYGSEKLLVLTGTFNSNQKEHPNIQKELIQHLYKLSLIFQSRIKEVTSPFIELQKTAEELKDLIPLISDTAVMLQTGNDREAMKSVLEFIGLSEKLIRIFPLLVESGYSDIRKKSVNDEEFNDFYKDLNNILSELVAAFDMNDSILIGDLMEYEIAPRITKLLEYVYLIEKVQE